MPGAAKYLKVFFPVQVFLPTSCALVVGIPSPRDIVSVSVDVVLGWAVGVDHRGTVTPEHVHQKRSHLVLKTNLKVT